MPEVSTAYLLERIGSACDRIAPIFQGNPAWGTMIQAGTFKGTLRLVKPPVMAQAVSA